MPPPLKSIDCSWVHDVSRRVRRAEQKVPVVVGPMATLFQGNSKDADSSTRRDVVVCACFGLSAWPVHTPGMASTGRAWYNRLGLRDQFGRCEAECTSSSDQFAVTCGQHQLRIGYLLYGSEMRSVVPSEAELFRQSPGTT